MTEKRRIKKVLAFIMALAVILSSAMINSFAFSFDEPHFSYEVQNGEAVITETVVLGNPKDNVIIPSELGGYAVTEIGPHALSGLGDSKSIEVHKGIKFIDASAFSGCSNLERIIVAADNPNYISADGVLFDKAQTTLICYPAAKADNEYVIPQTVEALSEYAFKNCRNAQKIVIGDNVSKIGKEALRFDLTSKIQSIDVSLNNNYYSSENGILFDKEKTKLIVYPRCRAEVSYNIPKTVEAVEAYAFYGSRLEQISIHAGVINIGENAFAHGDLNSIKVSKDNEYFSDLDGVLFNKDGTKLIKYPNRRYTSKIGGFTEPDDFKIDYIVPSSVREIGDYALENLEYQSAITLPDGVLKIGKEAFISVFSLKLNLPSSIQFIGEKAFAYCDYLFVTYEGTKGELEEVIKNTDIGCDINSFTYQKVLETPELVSAYSRVKNSVKITWKNVLGADGYQIFRSENPNSGFKCIKTIKDPKAVRYTNGGLEVGKTYYYKVRAYKCKSDGKWAYSDFSGVDYIPSAVTFNNVYSNATYRIRLLWNIVDGAEGYQLWRADSPSGDYRIVKTIKDGYIDAYSNTGLEAGKTYYYKMRAYYTKPTGEKIFGAFSDVQTVAAMPEKTVLTAESTVAGRVNLSWDAVNGAAGYQIWRASSGEEGIKLIKSVTDANTTQYVNRDLVSGKTYGYIIRAYTEVNGKKTFGEYSEAVFVTAK